MNGMNCSTGTEPTVTADELLQVVRRVDWRFLLPDPNLGQVAFMESERVASSARPALVDALRSVSASLTFVGRHSEDAAAPHDTVVIIEPTFAELGGAIEWLRPSGWLYAEVRRMSPLWRESLCYAGATRRPPTRGCAFTQPFRRLGLEEVEAHWHYPDFESCSEMVPLDTRAALLFAMARHPGTGPARLKSRLGQLAVRTGLLPWLIPCFSLVARRRAQGEE